jgi:myo-inositol-1(or 4)-monophosphatase
MENFIQKIGREAGKLTLKYFKKAEVQYTKSRNIADVVTQADLASNKFIVDAIKKKYPAHGIISEELDDFQKDAGRVWIIDPLDGTLNFSKGISTYAILIAFAKKGEVKLAVVYDPVHDDMYFAKYGRGAYLNKIKITCSQEREVGATTGCASSYFDEKEARILNSIRRSTDRKYFYLTCLLSIGICAAQTASGKRDWLFSLKGEIWDYAAPSLILKEAGCKVTNIKGKPWKLNDQTMLAANPTLHHKLSTHA